MLSTSRRSFIGGNFVVSKGFSQEGSQSNIVMDSQTVFWICSSNYILQRNSVFTASVLERDSVELSESCIVTEFTLKPHEKQGTRHANCSVNYPDNYKVEGDSNSSIEKPCVTVRPKKGSRIVGLPEIVVPKSSKTRKKKRKWRKVNAEDMGFFLSLFPRLPVTSEETIPEEEIFSDVMKEMDAEEKAICRFNSLLQLEGVGICNLDKNARRDRDKRERKAHRQIKTKNITSLFNNKGRKTLYIHFRIYKLFPFLQETWRTHPNLPSPIKREGVSVDVAKSIIKAQQKSSTITFTNLDDLVFPPIQSLAHALYDENIPVDLPVEVVSVLISLQHRDLTPEDYDLLLRLDDGVEPKTVSVELLSSFVTDVVDETSVGNLCSVCMELYEMGQNRKFLPCGHVFHGHCIDMWLTNSSINCPLDGLSVGVT